MWMNLEKLVQRRPTSSHKCIPNTTQRRALQTRILKMENYEKCRLPPLYMQSRDDCKSSLLPTALEKAAAMIRREEQVQSVLKLIPEKAWCQFISGTEHTRETCSIVFIWKWWTWRSIQEFCFSGTLTRQMWEDLFSSEIKIICPVTQNLNSQDWNIKLDLSIIASVRATCSCSKSGISRRSPRIYWKSRREQVRLQEELSMKEKVLRDSQIRSMHEMGEVKKETSRVSRRWSLGAKIKRESWDNTKAHFTNAGNARKDDFYDSGEFQEVESNYRGRLSQISIQPARISSPRSVLSCDRRLPLADICKKAADHEFFCTRWSFRRILWLETANVGAASRQLPLSTIILGLVNTKNKQATTCSDFPLEAMFCI